MKKKFIKIFLGIILIVLYIFIIRNIEIVKINGNSMAPNYCNGDIVVIWKNYDELDSGDVVVIKMENSQRIIKRIVAVDGEKLIFDNLHDSIIIDGNRKIENKGLLKTYSGELEIVIPDNSYYVLGDNFLDSKDSRIFGTINDSKIIGKCLFKIKTKHSS